MVIDIHKHGIHAFASTRDHTPTQTCMWDNGGPKTMFIHVHSSFGGVHGRFMLASPSASQGVP